MFDNRQKMEELKTFRPTSKVQLRQFCMWFAQGDVKKATEMYEFYAEGISLPDTEPVPPTRLQSFKSGAEDVMGFVRENQDDILTAVGFIKSLFGKGAQSGVAEPLANIN